MGNEAALRSGSVVIDLRNVWSSLSNYSGYKSTHITPTVLKHFVSEFIQL